MKTVALIPARNEARTIAEVIIDCEDYVDEVVVCDDGSEDSTARIAEGLGVSLLKNEVHEGKGAAMRKLFQKAVQMDADVAVTIDADLQHDPRDIPRLVEALKDADVAIGGREGIPPSRAVGNLLLRGFERLDTQSGFRAYRGPVLRELMPSEKGMGVDGEIFRKAKDLSLRVVQVPIKADYSVENPSKKNFAAHFLDVAATSFRMATFRNPLLYFVPGLAFVLEGLNLALQEWPYLATQGFGTVILLFGGFVCIQTAILIWNHNAMERRARR